MTNTKITIVGCLTILFAVMTTDFTQCTAKIDHSYMKKSIMKNDFLNEF